MDQNVLFCGLGHWLTIGIASLLIGGVFLWYFWEGSVRPRLIPEEEIKALADDLVARYGPRAEEAAFIQEDRAWRYADLFERGRWLRIRRALWRRYEAGEWDGPED